MAIKRLRVLPFAIFQMTIFGLIGLLCGIFYAFGGLVIDTMVTLNWLSPESLETPGLSYGTFLAFGALLGMPLIGLIFGFVAGLIGGIVFNFIAPKIGIHLPNISKE
ncbi:hypothetical protein [Croceivirga thetidis]|uniref:DUF3566 domain-containing protein n=1 Tax=Croceivirga thetidis TaxID=2721623 RepID=A0ABX1GKR9_9FLAO|nr:hypothetical protein [Croceivirga thetidis]NKI30497.1 hypothetical protein [Croceivirga thetidis]